MAAVTYSANDYAADTLSITLETLDEVMAQAETEQERAAIGRARDEVVDARNLVLEREAPTPTQKLNQALEDGISDE